ncbi:D-glycero-beta-D-manno-heptose-1,7-bisphosphate 7-phosphatase [Rubrivivax sp. A210]|uniref:D-glycero-alpha-D-manno-heptose-1,7-bisphosphate 7-phosphatase n=1 Tax=Rubrivivax sp. A210 TaxID=2772301 RepID=UPI0019A6D9A5|nr:HAD family hydrolase [Rubrivivax sp. A210]CAD5373653.1 D-glycero-beta-D-manno-heptose-1,7-bisphosphate 7-phosphatase [Rubrivivax sp. A210]
MRRTNGLRPGAFIDRDGVLNRDLGYVSRAADFHWLPGAVAALRRLQQAGLALVVVTNQSGIARGFYTEADFDDLTAHMRAELAREGVLLDGVYACPHLPQAVVAAYARECDCRKPRPGLILRAAAELGIDLAASCLFGDKTSDIAAGRAAGVARCWLIAESEAADAGADGVRASLDEAVVALLEVAHP